MADIDTDAERNRLQFALKHEQVENLFGPAMDYLDEIDRLQAENQRLREHIQYYSYCTRQGVRATEASYIEWEEAHRSLGFDIP